MSRYTRDPRWITTRYPGRCERCAGTIRKGDRAYYYPAGRHLYCAAGRCGGAEAAEFAAAVQDEQFHNAGRGY